MWLGTNGEGRRRVLVLADGFPQAEAAAQLFAKAGCAVEILDEGGSIRLALTRFGADLVLAGAALSALPLVRLVEMAREGDARVAIFGVRRPIGWDDYFAVARSLEPCLFLTRPKGAGEDWAPITWRDRLAEPWRDLEEGAGTGAAPPAYGLIGAGAALDRGIGLAALPAALAVALDSRHRRR